ncbi:hypothetical protein SCG7086_BO_00010, partial [Chlamydiales bacterium SCGC AG-110-P3]
MRRKLIFLLFAFIISAGLDAQENTARRWRDAQEYYETGRYELALIEYDTIMLASETTLEK